MIFSVFPILNQSKYSYQLYNYSFTVIFDYNCIHYVIYSNMWMRRGIFAIGREKNILQLLNYLHILLL